MRGLSGRLAYLGACLALSANMACDPFQSEEEGIIEEVPQNLMVTATSFPMEWLVLNIGGDGVTLTRLLPAGVDATAFSPSPESLIEAGAGDLIVANGAGYEGWMMTATLPQAKLVETSTGQNLVRSHGAKHSHGGEKAHSHPKVDPKTFSDPLLFLAQGEAVLTALKRQRPGSQGDFDKNFEKMSTALNALNISQEEALAPAKGRLLASNQPAFNYLARRYGLTIQAFDFHPEKVPSSKALDAVERWASGVDTPILLWESEPIEAVRVAFPEGTKHVLVDPLEHPVEGMLYDYLGQSWANVKVFQRVFGTELLKTP